MNPAEHNAMRSSISFVLDNSVVTENFAASTTPTTTVLNYLRSLPSHKGVKEGCAEGDCGACTVVLGELGSDNTIRYTAVDTLRALDRLKNKLEFFHRKIPTLTFY